MELEEAIKMVEYIKNETKLACEFPKATERDKNRWGKEVQALEVVLHYIKEESIHKAVVEEQIEELDKEEKDLQDSISEEEREEYSDANISFNLMDIEIRRQALQEILNKGEKDG